MNGSLGFPREAKKQDILCIECVREATALLGYFRVLMKKADAHDLFAAVVAGKRQFTHSVEAHAFNAPNKRLMRMDRCLEARSSIGQA